MGLKKIILLSGLGIPTIAVAFMNLFSGSAMNSLLPTPAAAADDHIKITREILLEGGTPVEPRVITQARDGGYVIAGSKGLPWATRVDSTGKVQWRHEARTSNRGGTYTGATILQDDSVILCGYQEVLTDTLNKTAGLLTHLDKAGQLLSERLIEPNDGQHHTLTQLNACALVGDEVVALGWGAGPEKPWPLPFGWIVTLDAGGNFKREKFSPVATSDTHPILRVMPDRDIVFNTGVAPAESGILQATRIVRIDSSGTIKARSAIVPNSFIQATPTFPDSMIRLVPSSQRTGRIITLNAQLNTTGQLDGRVELIISKRAYYLPDRSLVLFGGQEYHGNSFTASIARINPDLSKKSVLIIEPALASDAIVDAVPTGVPGEFATIRSVSPMSEMGRSDTRLGVVLAFVQINK